MTIDNLSAKIKSLEEEKTVLQNINCFKDNEHKEKVEQEIENIQNEIDMYYEMMDEAYINHLD
jgi:DNA-binding protein H-NS